KREGERLGDIAPRTCSENRRLAAWALSLALRAGVCRSISAVTKHGRNERRRHPSLMLIGAGGVSLEGTGVRHGACAKASFMPASSSACERSLRCVANDHLWPKGSVTMP